MPRAVGFILCGSIGLGVLASVFLTTWHANRIQSGTINLEQHTPERFLLQRKPRFGTDNPERMHVGHWEWMVRHRSDPYTVRKEFGLDYDDKGPDWCFDRFGMTRTQLPDGRIICIGGEHEDYYDPDFCIYNDVIILRPAEGQGEVTADSGNVEIYGYPAEIFPPTDFHSATLVGDRIYLIGRLGYQGRRVAGTTPVMVLDTKTYHVEPLATTGVPPGWIYRHHASYDPSTNTIMVRGGRIDVPGAKNETTNFSAYALDLANHRWTIVSGHEQHKRFLIRPPSHFYTDAVEEKPEIILRPKNISHEWLPPEDHGVMRYAISVRSVRILFETFGDDIQTLVEGDLPPETTKRLFDEITENLKRETQQIWVVEEVAEFDHDF